MKRILIFWMVQLLMAPICFGQWTNGSDIPEGIRAGNTESHLADNEVFIYIFGGRNDQDIISNKTYKYSLSSDEWETMANVPTPILGSSSAKIGDTVYILGGMVTTPGAVTKKVYKYSISGNSWTEAAEMPIPYTDGDAVTYQDSLIYTVGAYNSEKTWVYNSHTDVWREGSALPGPGTAISYGALSVYGNKLVYVGGSNGTFSPTYWDKVWIGEISQSDRSQITWSEAAPFPGQTRTFFDLRPWHNGLILIGGTTDNTFETYTDETYFYDVDADSWTELPSKPTAWNTGNSASIFLNNEWKMLCTGGFSTQYILNTEIFSQESMSVIENPDNFCGLKNMKYLGGKQPKLQFCTQENGSINLEIYDVQGRILKQVKNIANGAGKHVIDFPSFNLPKGLYFLKLQQNKTAASIKILIN